MLSKAKIGIQNVTAKAALKYVTETSVFEQRTSNFYVIYFFAALVRVYELKLNSMALVGKRTIPTERPPLVGEVSANLCG
jgi:hypothetical protein